MVRCESIISPAPSDSPDFFRGAVRLLSAGTVSARGLTPHRSFRSFSIFAFSVTLFCLSRMIILTFLCSDPSAGLRLHHRITECPKFLVLQCHVTAVAVSDQSCILQAQPSFFIHQAFFHRNSYDFRQKHIVSRKLPDVQHFAFKIYRRFPRWTGRKPSGSLQESGPFP